MVLIVFAENDLLSQPERKEDLFNNTEIRIPLSTNALTGIFIARYYENLAEVKLHENEVHCKGWFELSKMEPGLFAEDKLKQLKLEIFQKVIGTLPKTGDWLEQLKSQLAQDLKHFNKLYYYTIPMKDYSSDMIFVQQLRECLPELKAIIINANNQDGHKFAMLVGENELVVCLRGYLKMLETYQ